MKLKQTTILDDDQVTAMTHLMREAMPGLAEIMGGMGFELETMARMMSLAAKASEAREKLGLSVKEAAQQLKVAQYRIKDIEAGAATRIEPKVLRRYVEMLGLGRWVKRWAAANGELAGRVGLAAIASAKKKKKKAVPKKRKGAASAGRKAASAKAQSDLDIDYEMYLEAYAEDDDGGKRSKLTKARFAALSDEMMDLVNWENVERLPAAEKRRMKELEYLLIG